MIRHLCPTIPVHGARGQSKSEQHAAGLADQRSGSEREVPMEVLVLGLCRYIDTDTEGRLNLMLKMCFQNRCHVDKNRSGGARI